MPWQVTPEHCQWNSMQKQSLGGNFDALKDIPPMPTRPPPKIVTFDLDVYNFWPQTTTRSNASRKIKNKPLQRIRKESQIRQYDESAEGQPRAETEWWDRISMLFKMDSLDP